MKAKWRPDAFEFASVTLDSVDVLQPAAESPPLGVATTAVIGATFGAFAGGATWMILCKDNPEDDGCTTKWVFVTMGGSAVLGAAVGWIIGEIRNK